MAGRPLRRCTALLLLLSAATVVAGWRHESGYAPLRLAPCRGNATLSQQFRLAANGTIVSPTLSPVGPAYCLSVLPPQNGSSLNSATVVAADCGDPRFALQLWQRPEGGALHWPNQSLCFAVQQKRGVKGASEGFLLPNCSSAAAQFDVGFAGTSTGAIVHRASGMCITVGPCTTPPAPTPKPPWPPPGVPSSPDPRGTRAPCDIFGDDGSPCVAAHSTVRALYAAYAGALYSVTRSTDNTSKAIPVLAPGGYANSSAQDEFCAGVGVQCVIGALFDQSPHGNDLLVFHDATRQNRAANASADRHSVGGHPVYSLFAEPGVGYRTKPGAAKGVALGDEEESLYMVTSGTHYNDACCFD